jgi:PAB1-binding protein PBP1
MAKKVESETQSNGVGDAAFAGTGPNHQKSFAARDVVDLQIDGVPSSKAQGRPSQNGEQTLWSWNSSDKTGTSRFQTDTDISGGASRYGGSERVLQRWDGGEDTAVDLSLDGGNAGNGGKWDQFETNKRLYGVTSNYDESYYTTTIDRSRSDFKEREAEAERIAREIEGATSTNSHVAEERGHKLEEDPNEDEESK